MALYLREDHDTLAESTESLAQLGELLQGNSPAASGAFVTNLTRKRNNLDSERRV